MIACESFRYRALRADGAIETGALIATDREAVARQLGARGLLAVHVAPDENRVAAGRLDWNDLALGLRLLTNLLDAGLPLDRALAALAESAPPAWRTVLPAVRLAIAEGASLGDALARATGGAPALLWDLVHAGEAGGNVAKAAERAALVAESVAETRAAIRQALAYPAVLLGAGLMSLGFLTAVVLPRFAVILTDLGQSPPTTTRLVLGAAAVARALWLPALLVAAAAAVLLRTWIASQAGRLAWHRGLQRLPVLGGVRRSLATARVAGAVAALLECGVPLPQALAQGARASGDAAQADGLLRARERISQGAGIARSLAAEDALTPTAIRLVRSGEDTGRLGAMLHEAARFEGREADRRIRAAVQLMEPVCILLFGALVALVAAALLQALYSVRPV